MAKVIYLESIEDVKSFQVVSSKASEKYVPIFSSDIIEALAPEFTFVGGYKPLPADTIHYLDFENENKDTIRVYNSYNRNLALRMTARVDGFSVDLGLDRLIHRGKKAAEFKADLVESKEFLISKIENAKVLAAHLTDTKITKKLATDISNVIFERITKRKGFQGYTNYIDILVPKGISVKAYIVQSINKFLDGDFTYTISGVKKNGTKVGSVFSKIKLEHSVMDLITEEYMEFLL